MPTRRCKLIRRARRLARLLAKAAGVLLLASQLGSSARADRLIMKDGTRLEVDEAWEDAQGVWFRRGKITQLIDRALVRAIERGGGESTSQTGAPRAEAGVPAAAPTKAAAAQPVRIYLVGGAYLEVEEVNEGAGGAWIRRGNVSMFIEQARVERIERETLPAAGAAGALPNTQYDWSTGNASLDALIRQNGAAYGVDPYLIFCVMEQESHFNARAVSRVGARGLMQLMPATARRFGVRNPHDPAQSIAGGTRYLRELMGMFGGRVDLVLASYNAGEGAVMRYGQQVPPYAETRNYVKRISARYGGKPAARRKAPAARGAASGGVEE